MLLRHAKSDWKADYVYDRERPLNKRGIRSARAVGRFVTDYGLVPDLILTSPALRAATTADLAVSAGEWNTDIVVVPELYGADPAGLLHLIRGVSGCGASDGGRARADDVRLLGEHVRKLRAGPDRRAGIPAPHFWPLGRYDVGNRRTGPVRPAAFIARCTSVTAGIQWSVGSFDFTGQRPPATGYRLSRGRSIPSSMS